MEDTGIAWTNHTANFWAGCQRVSPGCENCYAEVRVTGEMGLPVWGPPSTTRRHRLKSAWKDVPKWNRKAAKENTRYKVFVSSLSDIFEDHPDLPDWRSEALALLESCTNLDVQLLTKRPENILRLAPQSWIKNWPKHVWIGTTVEDQKRAEQRIPFLLGVPAAVRFLSCEPLLEAVDLTNGRKNRWSTPTRHTPEWYPCEWTDPGESFIPVQWVIVGGESGPNARPFNLMWARSIINDCKKAGVPVFMKQYGDNPVETVDGSTEYTSMKVGSHHGADPNEWENRLRIMEFPGVT